MADNPISVLHRLRASSGPKETIGLSDDVIEDPSIGMHVHTKINTRETAHSKIGVSHCTLGAPPLGGASPGPL